MAGRYAHEVGDASGDLGGGSFTIRSMRSMMPGKAARIANSEDSLWWVGLELDGGGCGVDRHAWLLETRLRRL